MMLVFSPRPLDLGQGLFVLRVLRSARSRNVLEKDRQQHVHHARQHYHSLRGGVRREGLDDAVGRLMTADSFSCSLGTQVQPRPSIRSSGSRALPAVVDQPLAYDLEPLSTASSEIAAWRRSQPHSTSLPWLG
jgi:hypothetical protein